MHANGARGVVPRRNQCAIGISIFVLALRLGAQTTSGPTPVLFDGPNSTYYGTYPRGINNDGVIAGAYLAGDGRSASYHGFVRYPDGTLITLNLPGCLDVFPFAINNRTIGTIPTASAAPTWTIAGSCGGSNAGVLMDSAGNWAFITGPGNVGSVIVRGLNAKGQVTGYFQDTNTGGYVGFIWDAGIFTSFAPAGANVGTYPMAINDNGAVTGNYIGNSGSHGFLRDPQGNFTILPDDAQGGRNPLGISNNGTLIGNDSAGAFVRDPSGYFTYVAPTGSNGVYNTLTAISPGGQITGTLFFTDRPAHAGFFWLEPNGTLHIFDGTYGSTGINDSGAIIGTHHTVGDVTGTTHAFVLAQASNLAVANLLLPATSVAGGSSLPGNRLTLSGASPGAAVSLFSDNPAASVPAVVMVQPGQTLSDSFIISTTAVTVPTTVTISARFNGTLKQATITVNPATLSALTVSPSSVAGSVSVTGATVSLSGQAPAGGITVSLASDNPAVASVPASVVIPAGASVSPAFTITTTTVAVATPVTITASYNGVSTKQAVLTVTPPTLNAVTLYASNVVGSAALNGNTVSLLGQAPAGGATVQLSSDNAAVAAVPASVMVPAGTFTSAAFSITTATVSVPTTVTITATYGGTSKSKTLVVNPLAVGAIQAGTTIAGGSSLNGNRVTLNAAAPTGGAVVTLSTDNPAVASVPASVTVAEGTLLSSAFTITTTAVNAPTIVNLTATYNGIAKSIAITVTPASIATLTLSPSTIAGSLNTTSNTVSMAGTAANATIALSSDNPTVATVPPSVTIASGSVSPAFTITTTAVSTPTAVTISATYNGVTKQAILIVNPPTVSALSLYASNIVGTASLNNNTVTLGTAAPSAGATITLTSDNPAVATPPASITAAAGSTVSPTFAITTTNVTTPTTVTITATYNGVSKSKTLLVKPLAVGAILLVPSTAIVARGNTYAGNRLTLNAAAPAGGAVITLTTDNPAVASIPAGTVTVTAGALLSSSFAITTTAVAAPTPVTITATYNGITTSIVLTVTP